MKRWQLILLFIANFMIDYSILARYEIFGIIPSITLPLIVVLSMESRKESIVYYSIFQGLFQDFAFSNLLGSSALMYYLISYYTFRLNKNNNYNLFYGYLIISISLLFSRVYKIILNLLINRENFNFNILEFLQTYLVELIIMSILFTIFHFLADILKKRRKRNLL